MPDTITVLRQRSGHKPTCVLPDLADGRWTEYDVIRCDRCGRHYLAVWPVLAPRPEWKRVTRTRARWHARRRFLRLPRFRTHAHTNTEGITKL